MLTLALLLLQASPLSDSPVWLANCNGSRAVLLAVEETVSGDRRIRPLTGEAPVAGLAEATSALRGARWYAATGALAADAFPTPFAAPLWNDPTEAAPPIAGTALDREGRHIAPLAIADAGKWVLGPCTRKQKGLLATAPFVVEPLTRVPPTQLVPLAVSLVEQWYAPTPLEWVAPEPARTHATKGTATFTSLEGVRVFGGALTVTTASAFAEWTGPFEVYEHDDRVFRITDHDGRALTPILSGPLEPLRSLRWASDGAYLLVLPVPSPGGYLGEAFALISQRARTLEVVAVDTDRSGC